MFDTRSAPKKNLSNQVADAADLIIDFATLGEYGLEPIDAAPRPCEARKRPGFPRSTGSWNSAINHFATHS